MHSNAAAAFRACLLALGAFAGLGESALSQTALSPEETYKLARDAYLFAYPTLSMDVTMR